MIYVTGDTHGDWRRFEQDILPCASGWTTNDVLIICGDFGFVFFPEQTEAERDALQRMSALPFTIAFCDGNHENFSRLQQLPVEQWSEGSVHRLASNVFHLMRGEHYSINGKSVLVMGGGLSIDKSMRSQNLNWWPEEMPNTNEYHKCRRSAAALHHECDFIITHAAPLFIMQALRFQPGEELPLNIFLQNLVHEMNYEHWYFGHLHLDQPFAMRTMGLMHAVRNAETGERVMPTT